MRNDFVDYLNTLHSARGANANALAEAQITSTHYDKIHIRRRIGDYLAELLRNESHCIVLTGHAGDGKTGLLHQVLVALHIQPQSLERFATSTIPGTTRSLLYIKDMSELSAAEQEKLLLMALDFARAGKASILVSNTGPLLNTFKRLQDSKRLPGEFREFQSRLLSALDASEPSSVQLDAYSFVVVNMARIDNVGMAGLLLQKITKDDVWAQCEGCPIHETCPIYNNACTVRTNLERATRFMETYLAWLYENDCRLTLRQIIGQIAYAMTSDLSCERVHNELPRAKTALFNYHFANALWGFRGLQQVQASTQIRGIQALRSLRLDEAATPDDYNIFVRRDLSAFDENTRDLIDTILRTRGVSNEGLVSDPRIRRSVRRFHYLFASGQSQEAYDRLLGSLFSPVLPVYLRVRRGEIQKSDLHRVHTWITRGLYASIVGVPPARTEDSVPITVRPDRPGVTSVQLLIGKVPHDNIQVDTVPEEPFGDYVDDRKTHRLVMKLRGTTHHHHISLPLLDYLYRLGEGAMSTRLNPYLSHGIDRIKAALADTIVPSGEKIRLLILTTDGPKTMDLSIESDYLRAR